MGVGKGDGTGRSGLFADSVSPFDGGIRGRGRIEATALAAHYSGGGRAIGPGAFAAIVADSCADAVGGGTHHYFAGCVGGTRATTRVPTPTEWFPTGCR